MARKRIKKNAVTVPVPKDLAEARNYVRRIGEESRQAARIEAELNDRIAALREEYAAKAAPHNKAAEELGEGVRIWAEAHRDELTNHGKRKSVDLGVGIIGWRMRPPRVTVRGAEQVIETLKSLGLTRFLRIKEEVNKEAVLAEPGVATKVPGISIRQNEDFFVVPAEDDLTEAA